MPAIAGELGKIKKRLEGLHFLTMFSGMNMSIDTSQAVLERALEVTRQIRVLKDEQEALKAIVLAEHGVGKIEVEGHGTVTVVDESISERLDGDEAQKILIQNNLRVPKKIRITSKHVRVNPNV
jgi:hypothetical protein